MRLASPLSRALGLDPILDARLRERDVGHLTGLSFEEVETLHEDSYRQLLSRDPAFRPDGGESHNDCRERVGAWLDDTVSTLTGAPHDHGGEHIRVVVVSHGVAINHLLRHIVRVDPGENTSWFQIDNCSFTRVELRRQSVFRVLSVNATGHL